MLEKSFCEFSAGPLFLMKLCGFYFEDSKVEKKIGKNFFKCTTQFVMATQGCENQFYLSPLFTFSEGFIKKGALELCKQVEELKFETESFQWENDVI